VQQVYVTLLGAINNKMFINYSHCVHKYIIYPTKLVSWHLASKLPWW